MGHRIFSGLAIALLVACSGSDAPSPSASPAPSTPPAAQAPPTPPAAAPPASAQPTEAPTEVAAAPAPASSPQPAAVVERRYQEGRHFERLSPQQPTVATEGDRVEVVEVFQYSCPACFNFEPFVNQWKERKSDYVNFVRLPAPWNALSELHARAYYTAEALGVVEQIHAPFFREIHVNGNYLQNEGDVAEFFSQHGVDQEAFTSTYNSFAVHTKMQRGRDLVQRYRISATPEIIVAGKYRTGGQMAGSYEELFEIIDELAAVEHAAN